MNQECMIEYIYSTISALRLKPAKQFIMEMFAPILGAVFLVLVPGLILGKYWLWIGVLGTALLIVFFILTLILLRKSNSVKKYLLLQFYVSLTWSVMFTITNTIFFTMKFGINVYLFLILIIPYMFPLAVGISNAQKIKKNIYSAHKRKNGVPIAVFGGVAGLIGMRIGTLFEKTSQDIALMVMLFCGLIVTLFMAYGLLSIQKLYYVKMLEKYNPATKEVFELRITENT